MSLIHILAVLIDTPKCSAMTFKIASSLGLMLSSLALHSFRVLTDERLMALLGLACGSPPPPVDLAPVGDFHAAAAVVVLALLAGGLEHAGLKERILTSAHRLPFVRLALVVQVAHSRDAVLLADLGMAAEAAILGTDEVPGASQFYDLDHAFLAMSAASRDTT